MPLLKGRSKKTISANIDTLMGEIGKSKHVKNRKQAIAIAYSQARRSNVGYHTVKQMKNMMKRIHGYDRRFKGVR